MTVRALALSAVACAALTLGAWSLLDLSLSRALVLAPVIMLTASAAVFLVLLWAKVIWESVRRRPPDETL